MGDDRLAGAGCGSVDPRDHPPRPFPPEAWAWFVEGCRRLAIPDPEPRRSALEALYGHLCGVNAWLNLTRITAPQEYLKNHILDSLGLLAWPGLGGIAAGERCLDLGSGGGYPGLPLALWLANRPWVLVDSRRRKAAFLAAAARIVGPDVAARCLRGREAPRLAPDLCGACRLVVARAVAPLALLLAECRQLLLSGGWLVAWKGPDYEGTEHAAAVAKAASAGFAYAGCQRVRVDEADPERVLVLFRKT